MRKAIVISTHLIIFALFFIFSYDSHFFEMIKEIKSSEPTFNNYFFNPFLLINIISLTEFIPNFYAGYFIIPLIINSKRKYLWSLVLLIWLIFAFLLPVIFSETFTPISRIIDDLIYMSIGLGTRLSLDYLFQRIDKNKLEKENLRTQLENLKNQINPHFLFNTLHNIEGLIETNPDKASEMILKLSDIMRFMVYDTNQDMIDFAKEINATNDLLDLHRIRFEKDIVRFNYDKDLLDLQVPPLILLTIVENAFKHYCKINNSEILNINLELKQGNIIIHSSNPFKELKEQQYGIGLKNLRQRLELMYGDRFSLMINKNNNLFKLKLEINIL